MSSCCLGHYPFSNMPKMDFWSNGNSIHDTMRTGTVTKDTNAWSLCWYYYYWHNCVTTWCTSFTKAINAASECLPILAHTSLHIPIFNPIRKLLLQENVKKKKKVKSQCQVKENKSFQQWSLIYWKQKSSCKIKTIMSYMCFYFQISRNLREFPGMYKGDVCIGK